MKKENNSMARLGGILCAITLIAALLLGAVNAVTAPIIEQLTIETQNNAMKEIFPDAGDFPTIDIASADPGLGVTAAYQAKDSGGKTIGCVVQVTSMGFGGAISMMVGVDADMNVVKVKLLSLSETPGLGMKSKEPDFIDQYEGKNGELTVEKGAEPGPSEIRAITGATITSRAVTAGVNAASTFAAANMQ